MTKLTNEKIVKRLRIAARHDESQGRMMSEAADLIEQQQREIEEQKQLINRMKDVHYQVDSWNEMLEQENQALAAHVELIKKTYNQAGVDIQMLFDIQPKQDDNSYLVDGQDCTELNRVIMQSPQASLAEKEEPFPDCDTCGKSMSYMPWHYSKEDNRHLHACDECWPAVNPLGGLAEVRARAVEDISCEAFDVYQREQCENGKSEFDHIRLQGAKSVVNWMAVWSNKIRSNGKDGE